MTTTASAIAAFLVAIGLAAVGLWLLQRVRQAKETGVARFPLERPTGFVREEQPLHFRASVVRNTIFGIVSCAMAGAIIVVATLSLAF